MATTTLTSGQRQSGAIALAASTVDTVNFPTYVGRVRVWNFTGASAISFTVDGSTPTVGGAATHSLPAAIGYKEVNVPAVRSTSTQALAATSVKLISAATPSYNVEEA